MNTIIVLTDLVEENDNSFSYAVVLSRKLQASLVLMHFYELPVSMPESVFPVIVYEDLQKGVTERLARQKEHLQAIFPDITIEAESALGDLGGNIQEALKKYNSPFVVMSSRGERNHSLFGSNTMSVIRNAHFPVVVVPDSYTGGEPKTLLFASDLDLRQTPVASIIKVVKMLGVQLHILHVNNGGEDPHAADELVHQLAPLQPVYHSVRDEEVGHGIQESLSAVGADMLMILPHEHSLLERFFLKLHTNEIVHTSTIPVLCINH
jgi:nucleotide-binding universal stress UspA family protein